MPPALFIFAHHDDEIFVSVTLRQFARTGSPVLVAWLTRGGLYAERRQFESQRAMQLLGVEKKNLFFFSLPDNRSLDYLEEIVKRIISLIERHNPTTVFVPAFEGGHQDHDTAQLAAVTAIRRLQATNPDGPEPPFNKSIDITLYEFPIYHKFGCRILCVGKFIPDASSPTLQTPLKLRDRLLRQKLARIYRSQRLLLYPLLGLNGGPMMMHLRGEPYRRVLINRSLEARPHPGRLAYEYLTRRRFRNFANRVREINQEM